MNLGLRLEWPSLALDGLGWSILALADLVWSILALAGLVRASIPNWLALTWQGPGPDWAGQVLAWP